MSKTLINNMLLENKRRNKDINRTFNPLTGEGSILPRIKIRIEDFSLPVQWIPERMMRVPLVRQLSEAGSICQFLKNIGTAYTEEDKEKVVEQFIRIRIRYDFCFWAYFYVLIKNKDGGDDIHFRLNRPQRRLVTRFERMRLANNPIRLILLKARQWGGSTVTQIYMAWIQLVHKTGWNSLIVGHVKDASTEVKGMFDKMLDAYPLDMLYSLGESHKENEPKMVGVGGTSNISRIPQRNCKIKLGTAERPDSARGGDSALVHCTEVAFWKKTEGKTPEQIIRSACSGTLPLPLTLIVYESTANGTGNFFQREYDAAKSGKSMFESLFVAWWEIEKYALPVTDEFTFAKWLYTNRNNENVENSRQESGQYYWKLWEMGATLQAIQWYMLERTKYEDHGDMAAEYPSDDTEAFVHSGARVLDKSKVDKLKPSCRPPKYIGDIYADGDEGDKALENLRFSEDHQGKLWVWNLPERFEEEDITDRYLTVVDIGGRSKKADWSVIVVYDRYWMIEGGKPAIVAQWYGHIDMDLLAWKAAQIAAFYNESLLVIESNTLETKDRDRNVEGDQTSFILNQIKDIYPNLYARRQSEEDIVEGKERKYGFHTNVSTKPMVISTLIKVIRESMYIERDERCLDEYVTYEKKQNGSYGAIAGKHDDLLMTRAIGLHICFFEMDLPKVVPVTRQRRKRKASISVATI